ncbi:Protein N-acetyltransferase, RimJ/RimL family [Geodermatophilus dictyosporus]|uniref:Protein N-acetyltransferase, RimJ/RimL family n=1 Tax=Geodermatophilus dictyosporus TaxID=1523247 RepID=A0A1I5L5A1_9ACTN|nr:GNAT family N-acetyltransferase [Geodermatophilus dictyosporus]SFO92477.1 Protein N-acetyltransferase, RimJ/RimL family [Geodermatophilus dictyosporus]
MSVRLRVPTTEDAGAWADLFDDAEVMRYVGTGEVRDRAWYAAFVQRQQELAERTGLCLFSVLVAEEVAGFTGIQPWTQPWGPTGVLEIGWRLGRRFWGRGIATEAGRTVLDRARTLEVPRVVAMVHADNAASLAVARKLGLIEEAALRAPSGVPVLQYGVRLTAAS